MEIIVFCITLTAIMAIMLVGIGVLLGRIDKGIDKRKLDDDTDTRIYVPSRDRHRSGDQSDYFGLDDEAVKGILYVMRMSVRYSEAERLAIDYCIDRLEAENG